MTNLLSSKMERILADMGDSPESIAAFLEGQGIKAIRKSSTTCAVAQYMNRTLVINQGDMLSVDGRIVRIYRNTESGLLIVADAVATQAIRNFIHNFDKGEYPQLEDVHSRITREEENEGW